MYVLSMRTTITVDITINMLLDFVYKHTCSIAQMMMQYLQTPWVTVVGSSRHFTLVYAIWCVV